MAKEERLLSSYADELIGDSNATDDDTVEFNPLQLVRDGNDTNENNETDESADNVPIVVKK